VAAANDTFGSALAVGDFNTDGFDDLAIGVRGDVVAGVNGAGSVNVIYGSASGLRATGDQLWNQETSGINDVAEEFDGFGTQLTTGDFDGDGLDDLAAAACFEDVGIGLVHAIYGTALGLSATDDQIFKQGAAGILDAQEANDNSGR
jgi:hypothetical protein